MSSIERTGTASDLQEARAALRIDAARDTKAGLVLLYAPSYAKLSAAYPFFTSDVVVGRDPTCSVPVVENAVSRTHARFVRSTSGWEVVDQNSRNGTIVGGRLVERAALEHGEEVRIGDAIFKFLEHGVERHAGFALDGARVPAGTVVVDELVGGAQMSHVADEISRVARTPLSCVIAGETGTGKEVVARAMHRLSERRGSLQAVNCAAIPQALLESELFGYKRGAFSGADRDKPGLVKLADGGTLFLDEIGDMHVEAQAKLLRVLQSREVFPLGASAAERVDVRVVCATHRDLPALVREGRFRGDLYARLNEHTLRLPPLRDRKEDVHRLVRTFLARAGRPDLAASFPFMVALLHHDWPYNVRELESCIKRGIALCSGPELDTPHLPEALADGMRTYGSREGQPSEATTAPQVASTSRSQAPSEADLRALLTKHGGNVAAVGRALGKERMQIHRWLKRYAIDLADFRGGEPER